MGVYTTPQWAVVDITHAHRPLFSSKSGEYIGDVMADYAKTSCFMLSSMGIEHTDELLVIGDTLSPMGRYSTDHDMVGGNWSAVEIGPLVPQI